MRAADHLLTIIGVEVAGALTLHITWSNGVEAEVDVDEIAKADPFRSLGDPAVFDAVEIGDWGHSLVWPGEVEMGADALWRETLKRLGREDTYAFLSWRLRNALSIEKAAAALGLSASEVARYSNGIANVPKAILLACRGWEALQAA